VQKRFHVTAGIAATALVAVALAVIPAGTASATTTITATYGATTTNTFTVPSGVTSIHIEALGGSGGGGPSGIGGGQGALVSADFAVTAGEQLDVHVAGNGASAHTAAVGGATAGANGGGATPNIVLSGFVPSGGGGGGSDVRTSGNALSDRILVAGGGGGGTGSFGDGAHAGAVGGAGSPGIDEDCGTATVAQPGTQTGGGAGGTATCAGDGPGNAGLFGEGGDAGFDLAANLGGGGGGGGYYGGGGGSAGGSGAGGSSYADAAAQNVTSTLGAVNASPYVNISYLNPAATQVSVGAVPASIPADGTSTTTITATLSNGFGTVLGGEDVEFSSSDPGDSFGTVTDHDDGTYTVVMTASASPGSPTITATDESTSPAVSGTTQVTQTLAPATAVSVGATLTVLPADGSSTTLVTATVTNVVGTRVPGDTIVFSSTDPAESFGTVTDNSDGTYSSVMTASTTVDTPTLTATDTSAPTTPFGTIGISQTTPAASTVTVSASMTTLVANGTSTVTLTALVTNVVGTPIPGEALIFSSSDPGQTFGLVNDNADGTYSVTLTSSNTPGRATITVTDASSQTATDGTLVITQVPVLATTGVDPLGGILAAIALLLVGLGAIVVRRRASGQAPR
jgi:adhesin/invasin